MSAVSGKSVDFERPLGCDQRRLLRGAADASRWPKILLRQRTRSRYRTNLGFPRTQFSPNQLILKAHLTLLTLVVRIPYLSQVGKCGY